MGKVNVKVRLKMKVKLMVGEGGKEKGEYYAIEYVP